jgi:redox-sensitive bicupin YhaK (pirin superfamily)
MTQRELIRAIPSQAASDGAGVKLRRSIGAVRGLYLDPFLMLDEFYSDNPDDYLAGFPDHPHRGFETVTYMLDGHMQHRDHLGNRGDLGPGSVQWMTAGRGVIHSEMPQQSEGRMRGFQLWINLPAAEKMKPAAYRDIPADGTPQVALDGGGQARVIAGTLVQDSGTTTGPISGLSTEPLYFDLHLPPNTALDLPLPAQHTAFVYVYEGDVRLGTKAQALPQRAAGVLGPGERLRVVSAGSGARLLLLAGKALNEPVVQYGPFVMNTREEIEQALADYQQGRLATA